MKNKLKADQLSSAPVSVIIPTCRRADRLKKTLFAIEKCRPKPSEIVVHVDTEDCFSANMIRRNFQSVKVLEANESLGPGGARNKLIFASRFPYVVSFDDDSYPIDTNIFEQVVRAFSRNPKAGVLAMAIFHEGEPAIEYREQPREVADFVGCGCAYRRRVFLMTTGYVPLKLAYGMEETDIALQLYDLGWKIIGCEHIRIRHATNRHHQTANAIVASHVRNTALLAFLRYPLNCTGYAVSQFINRALYSIRRGHVLGVVLGIAQVPSALFRHRKLRNTVRGDTVRNLRALRKKN